MQKSAEQFALAVVYASLGVVALAGIWCISLLFRDRREALTE